MSVKYRYRIKFDSPLYSKEIDGKVISKERPITLNERLSIPPSLTGLIKEEILGTPEDLPSFDKIKKISSRKKKETADE